uniref:phosphatidylinositol-3,4,5-trisphosphate 5-phosphatase n=1 Tax=Oncorhynchus mykiss TaxID=8022 RepID=A0A8K9Y8G1_ONCMY
MSTSYQPWHHGNITRSKAEDLLSKAAKDGSFLLRDSESIQGAYALCVLFQNCVYTYRILPNEERKLSVQASEGVPIRFFSVLADLVETYYSPNMGLATHLQFPVQKEEEPEEEPGQIITCLLSFCVSKGTLWDLVKGSALCRDCQSFKHQQSIQEYFHTSLCLDAEQAQNGNPNFPRLKKLTMGICKHLNRYRRLTDNSRGLLLQVKSELLGLTNKMFIKVDVETGKIYFKKYKDGPEDKYFVHNKILQLVKSQKVAKLVIVVETEKEKTLRKEFVFDDTKKREGFCQLLQQMKNKHSDKPEPDMITVFVGTWNMGNASPPHSIASWFQCKGQGKTRDDTADHIPHDIYVIGTQEDPLGEKEWIDTLKSALRGTTNISFKQVNLICVWETVERPNVASMLFFLYVLGNKGAVGVSFMFNGTSFGFVNSHLTSGSEKKLRRNQNYVSILRFLNLGDKKLNPFDITHRFTHLFWLGDLNYRIELPSTEAESIVTKIKQQQYQELLCRDQLTIEKGEGKVFLHYDEEEITFAPTYRFERDTREKYAYTKAKATGTKYNLPSWCDRVLRRSYPLVHVFCQSYGCTNDIMTSDHSPVFSTFEVGVSSQFVSKHDPNSVSQGGIKFMNCVATLMTKSKTKFFLEYHSSCLEKFVKSSEGENQDHSDGNIKVRFGNQLVPIISDPEYLLDQHILLCVKSTDCDESYGEGCVALRAAESSYTEFQVTLTHHGERTGTLTGGVQLRTSGGKQTEKLYGERLRTNVIVGEDEKPAEMFDNPLYGSMGKSGGGAKDSPDPQSSKDHLTAPDPYFSFPKPSDQDPDRPPVPTPRNRSYTCSETKPPSSVPTSFTSLHPLPYTKNPVKPSRSEGGMVLTANKPPLPMKSRPGQAEATSTKPRDYRDSSELPSKLRPTSRPIQPLPKEG